MILFLKKVILCALASLMILPASLAIEFANSQVAKASMAETPQLEQIAQLPNPVLIAPASLAILNNPEISFSWQPVSGEAGEVVYDLQIDGSNVLSSLNSTQVQFDGANLSQGMHTWAVAARYADQPISEDEITPASTFSIDTISPVFTDNGLLYSAVYGETVPEQNILAKKIAGRYVVPMSGQEEYIYLNSLFGAYSEAVEEQINPIYYSGLSSQQKSQLETYYSRELFNDGSGEYLLQAIDGLVPIAYLRTEGEITSTIDALVYSATDGETIIPFAVPGNFPVGVYNFVGNATDLAGNIGEVKFSIEFTRTGLILPAPANFTATPTDSVVDLAWDEVTGALSYNVYYKKSSDTAYGNPINIVGNQTTINALESGTTYDFMVSAVSSQDVVGQSASISATTISVPVTPPIADSEPMPIPKPAIKEATPVRVSIVTPAAAAPAIEEDAPSLITPEVVPEESDRIEETVSEGINWTPWVILFMLILLAGAATGAYFYWFGSDEEIQNKNISEPKVVESKEKQTPKTKSEAKTVTSKTKESPPPKRW